ncbi:hypothetical protein SFRURICE_017736 [Spodoptera frugiperda]|nr:hypothetical protein SFRURICE_017736 [Spodoptera frugiperda]
MIRKTLNAVKDGFLIKTNAQYPSNSLHNTYLTLSRADDLNEEPRPGPDLHGQVLQTSQEDQ